MNMRKTSCLESFSKDGLVWALPLIALLAWVGAASAQPCVVPDNGGGTVYLPPAGCGYLSPSDVHEIINGLPAGTTIVIAAEHKAFFCGSCFGGTNGGHACKSAADCPGGQCRAAENPLCSFPVTVVGCDQGAPATGEQECSNSTLALTMQGTGTLSGFHRQIDLPINFETHVQPRTPGSTPQSFDTDMFKLQGQLPAGDPDFDLLRIRGGTDFAMPSPGHTTLTRLGAPGSNWAVDSFFDIFYDIEFIGAPGGPLAGHSGSTTATIRMEVGLATGACCNLATNECHQFTDAVCKALGYRFGGVGVPCGSDGTCIPTLSEWGVAVMAMLVLTAGTIVVMRRRAAATA